MPEIRNQTGYAVEAVPLIDRDGRNVVVAIAKGTYGFTPAGALELAPEQEPIAMADVFVGDPVKSDCRIPSDLLDFKPATDVLVIRPPGELDQAPIYRRRLSVQVGPVKMSGKVGAGWDWGPLRRDKRPRKGYAGTYNQAWIDNRMPLLPEDFDPRFHQSAPAGQQVQGFLKGGEPLVLVNVTAENTEVRAALPGRIVVVSGNVMNDYFATPAVLDTVLVWTEKPRVSLVWRHVIRPRQKVAEVCNVQFYLVRERTAKELFTES